MPHLERALGPYEGLGLAKPEWNVPFSAFRWADAPEPGIDTLVSFGVAAHLLEGERRQEVAVALRREWEDVALSIVVSVGMYILDRHAPIGVGETVRVPRGLETNVERFTVRPGDDLVAGLGVCDDYDPPIEIVWLEPGGDDRYGL